MVKKILIALVAIIAVLAVVIVSQPDHFQVTRSAVINAPPADAFAVVNDFHQWDKWSPWAKLDPAMKTTFSGAAAGPGAVYQWIGNDQVGEGRMTILDTKQSELVHIKLEFLKPFASTSDTEFAFVPEANGVTVKWTMRGENNFMSKAVCLFMGGMDKMIGPDFDKGLAQMKAAVESAKK